MNEIALTKVRLFFDISYGRAQKLFPYLTYDYIFAGHFLTHNNIVISSVGE